MKRKDIVRYCPGTSGGSPAHMLRTEAEAHMERDIARMNRLDDAGALSEPTHWPHINGTCPACRQETQR